MTEVIWKYIRNIFHRGAALMGKDLATERSKEALSSFIGARIINIELTDREHRIETIELETTDGKRIAFVERFYP